MTVNVQKPYNDLVGSGSITRFAFTFGVVETYDIVILVAGVLQVESSAYVLENLTDIGGDIVFTTAPALDASVLILRRTTMTQQVDYVSGSPFQAETHENGLDKIIYILQELIGGAFGGLDSNGDPVYLSFDLSVTAGVATVTINNSGGTDAVLPAWVSGTKAGVFHGEITDSAPADESATTEEDGYVWIET